MRIDVRDNGKGIPDDKLEELNSPEYAPHRKTSISGFGM